MSVRAYRMLAASVCAALLAGSGCCPNCASRCTPRGPWQSPTIQATRAFLVVNTEELRILRIDGRNVRPSCVGEGGVREYHLPPGTHSITAMFCYAAPVAGGVTGAVRGVPVTIERQFIAGHEYVPIYRVHTRSPGRRDYLAYALASALRPKHGWSLDVVDLMTTQYSTEPEVIEAREYCNILRGLAVTSQAPALY